MRKLLLALSGAMLSFYSFADLGEIKVNSYLSQPLNATIPITGISEASLSELAIGLASSAKFKNNGISFSPELGSLQFKIVNSKGSPFLQITSNRAISSPVLKMLLHYQQNNDDFYRQYTLLLDPIEVNDNVVSHVSNSAAPARFKREVVMHKISGEKPIAVSNNPSKINPNLTTKNLFVMDLTNPYVMQRLANFDQKSMTYTTISNDNLYAIARFEQLIYPHALFNLNQIIIALGLENYPKIKPLGQPYESGVKILLVLPQDVNLIQAALADQYLLGASLSSSERLGVLRAMATAFDVSLKIESADLFVGKNSVMAVASAPVVKKHFALQPLPVAYEDKGLIDIILEYKYYLGLGLLLVIGVLLLNKKIKLRAAQNKNLLVSMPNVHPVATSDDGARINSVTDRLARNNVGERNLESFDSQELESVVNSAASIEGSDEIQTLSVSNSSFKPVDEELIHTLEHLLSFDDTRDDIRYKLLELYLGANRIEAANLVYAKLDQSLDSDSSLRGDLINICTEYDFVPNANLVVTTNNAVPLKLKTELVLDEQEVLIPSVADLSAQEKEQLLKKLTPELIHEQTKSSAELNELSREIDFTPHELVTPDVPVDALGADFASERVMDFSGFSQISSSAVEAAGTHVVPASVPDYAADTPTHHELMRDAQVINSALQDDTRLDIDCNLDEKLNLAQMYYQIEELAKAREILIELINSSGANSSIKVQAQQLLTDLGLNG